MAPDVAPQQTSPEASDMAQQQTSSKASDMAQQQPRPDASDVAQQQSSSEGSDVAQQQSSSEASDVAQQQTSPKASDVAQQQSSPDASDVAQQQSSSEASDVAQQQTSPKASRIDRLREAFGLPGQQETSEFGVPVITRSLDEYPRGYPKVAAFQDCDPMLRIFRKFGWLQIHVLLDLQDELQALEEELEEHNTFTFDSGQGIRLCARRLDYKREGSRKELISQIHQKLIQYDDQLLRMHKVQAIKSPTDGAQNSLYNFISVDNHILQSGYESRWICRSDDLASVSGDAKSDWLKEAVENIIGMIPKGLLLMLFRTPQQKIRTGSSRWLYMVSPRRVEFLLRALLAINASALLVVPAYLVLTLQRRQLQFATIFVSALAFSASCSGSTKAERQKAFLAASAYAAVLVLFLGVTIGSNNLST